MQKMNNKGLHMKKMIEVLLILITSFSFVGCSRNEGVSVIKTYLVTNEDDIEKSFENDQSVVMKEYMELSDGTWKCGDVIYKYRLEITGRISSAGKESTFVYLSNLESISFEQACKAAGFSSNTKDYFDAEDATLVELK